MPPWELPAVVGPVLNRPRDAAGAGRSAWEDAIFKQGFAAGAAAAEAEDRARGHAEGLELGRVAGRSEFETATAAVTASATRLEQVLNLLARPLAALDAEVERELIGLTLTVARQLVRRELRIDPAQVIAIIRETVALLPAAARDVRVHLHPEDAAVVRERLTTPAADRAWTLVEDPVLGRGGCRVTTDTARIDARLESRVAAIASAVLGDERSLERSATDPPATSST